MGAALGAAGNVQVQRAVEQAAVFVGDFGREPSRRDMAGRASRRAGAGRDRLPGIVGRGDEAQRFRLFLQRFAPARPSQSATSVRFGAGRMSSIPRLRGRFGEGVQQLGSGVAEGQGDAEGVERVAEIDDPDE